MLVWIILWGCVASFSERQFIENPIDDFDGDGQTELEGDCDDSRPEAFLGAQEICDGIDNDCNGEVDEATAVDAVLWFADTDNDGFGQQEAFVVSCSRPVGFVEKAGDCNDNIAAINPNMPEVCSIDENGVPLDDNCNGLADEEDPDLSGTAIWYRDADRDSWGDPSNTREQCERPDGYVLDGGDCDDSNALIYPDAEEICDAMDNDCDGATDDADANALPDRIWYIDADGDGFGSSVEGAATLNQCSQPEGYAAEATDCDDDNLAIHPLAVESCDQIDDDCNGLVDDGVEEIFYRDADGDGFGDMYDYIGACSAPTGFVDNFLDCDDLSATNYPNADEICDDVDNDCDGTVDEDDAVDAPLWYRDVDADGFGDPIEDTLTGSNPRASCTQLLGYVADATDCDDTRSMVNPDQQERCNTPYDDDCSGTINDPNALGCSDFYYDGDADGFGVGTSGCLCVTEAPYLADNTDDCDDTDGNINPGETESCATTYDDNCDGIVNHDGEGIDTDGNRVVSSALGCNYYFLDSDGDDFGVTNDYFCFCDMEGDYRTTDSGDCDDSDVAIHPAAAEVCDVLNVDENCDGSANGSDADGAVPWYYDNDGDNFGIDTEVVIQCDAPVGYVAAAGDCNDDYPNINPGAQESCLTAYDDNCDGNDNDDGAIDCIVFYKDTDADTYGDANYVCTCVEEGDYTARNDDDCDDGDAQVYPTQVEMCSTVGVDDNCNGTADEDDADDCTFYFYDYDGDTYGTTDYQCMCAPDGYYQALQSGDCADDDASSNISTGYCGLVGEITPDSASYTIFADEAVPTIQGNFDFNGDGLQDVVFGVDETDTPYVDGGSLHVFLSPLPVAMEIDATPNADIVVNGEVYNLNLGAYLSVGDFNGDGVVDILSSSADNTVDGQPGTYLFSAADLIGGTYTEADAFFSTTEYSVFSVGDVNGDGIDDVYTLGRTPPGWWSDHDTLLLGSTDLQSTGFVESGINLSTYFGSPSYKWGHPPQIGHWDFNGDGLSDIIDVGRTSIFAGDAVQLDEVADFSIAFGSDNKLYPIGDFTGDGQEDVAVSMIHNHTWNDPVNGPQTTSSVGRLHIFQGGGQADLSDLSLAYATFQGSYYAHNYRYPLGAGDHNNDGADEILIRSGRTDQDGNLYGGASCVTIWYGGVTGYYQALDADGYFTSASTSHTCSERHYLGQNLGDVTGDSIDDLLLLNHDAGSGYWPVTPLPVLGSVFVGGNN